MKIQLFTSLSGIKNRIEGKVTYAFTEECRLRNDIDSISILVDEEEIHNVEESGLIILKPNYRYNEQK